MTTQQNAVCPSLLKEGYNIWNVGTQHSEKAPTWGKGWNDEHTHEEYVAKFQCNGKYGIYSGKQTNGDFVFMLDFDNCKKIDGTDTYEPCYDYLKFCEEWKAVCRFSQGYGNGAFRASTKGNANWLMRIKEGNCPSLIENFNKLGAVFNVGGLEVCIHKNCLLPPTMTTCKLRGEALDKRIWYDPEKPFYDVEEGTAVYDFINKFTTEQIEKLPKAKKAAVAVAVVSDEEGEKKSKVNANERTKWLDALAVIPVAQLEGKQRFAVLGALKKIGFSQNEVTNWADGIAWGWRAKWDSIINNNQSVGTIMNMMKLPINKERYLVWLGKYRENYYVTMTDLADTFKMAELMADKLRRRLRYCEEKWWSLDEETALWRTQKVVVYEVVEEVRKYIEYTNARMAEQIEEMDGDSPEKDVLVKTQQRLLKMREEANKPTYKNGLVDYLKNKLRDDKFADLLDSNLGKLAFQNGMLDLETKDFRYGLVSDDYCTYTIPFDYEPVINQKKYKELTGWIKQIANNNDEHLQYMQRLYGFSMIGMPQLQKAFYFLVDGTLGKGDNGKSIIPRCLTKILPKICRSVNAKLLYEGNDKTHKTLIGLRGCRMLFLDEFENKAKGLNDGLIKCLAQGGSEEVEVMHGTTQEILIQFKVFIATNHIPKIAAHQSAVYNRYNQFTFLSHFDRTGTIPVDEEKLEFQADTGLEDKIIEHYQMEMVHWLLDGAADFYKNKKTIPIPAIFKSAAEDTKNENDDMGKWYNGHCEEIDGGKLWIGDILTGCLMNPKNKEARTAARRMMEKKGFVYDDALHCGTDHNGARKQGGWKGVREKPLEEGDD